MQFGEKIRNLRQHAGLTQPELAERLNCEQSWLSKIETYRSTIATWERISCGRIRAWVTCTSMEFRSVGVQYSFYDRKRADSNR